MATVFSYSSVYYIEDKIRQQRKWCCCTRKMTQNCKCPFGKRIERDSFPYLSCYERLRVRKYARTCNL